MSEVNDPTKGNQVILSDGVSFLIEGKTYKMRRLGIRDVFTVWDMLKEVYSRGGTEVSLRMANIIDSDESNFAATLVLGFPYIEGQLMGFLADLLSVTEEDLQNPDKFPMETVFLIIEGLKEHPDMTAFLARLQEKYKMLLEKLENQAEETKEI